MLGEQYGSLSSSLCNVSHKKELFVQSGELKILRILEYGVLVQGIACNFIL